MSVLAFQSVTKQLGDHTVLHDVSFDVQPGEAIALLGPNGAGKSTLIELAAGLRRPESGAVTGKGRDPRHASARRHLGLMPQESDFPDLLGVEEVITFVAAHRNAKHAVEETILALGLAGVRDRVTAKLSGGQRRRLAAALAFVGAPSLSLLDEPTVGLDTDGRHRVASLVRDHCAAGGSAIVATHELAEADAVASRVIVLAESRVIYDGDIQELRTRAGATRIAYVNTESRERTALTTDDPVAALSALIAAGETLDDLEVRPVRLEDVVEALVQ